ncbi:ATP-dependent DNA helicase Q4 [Hordeum vulgare]|nr:ATP-dependent DNA helicase Q4 [Hordeum vulgare]
MASNGFDSFISRSVDHELIPCDPDEEMAIQVALRRPREEVVRRQHSDSQRRESIASAQPVLGSDVAASSEVMRSISRSNIVAEAQPLRWRVEHEAWSYSDDVMARRARRVRQRAREAVGALAAVGIGEAESHSLAPRRVDQCGRRNCAAVDVGSSEEGSVIDLMSTENRLYYGLRRGRVRHGRRRELNSREPASVSCPNLLSRRPDQYYEERSQPSDMDTTKADLY